MSEQLRPSAESVTGWVFAALVAHANKNGHVTVARRMGSSDFITLYLDGQFLAKVAVGHPITAYDDDVEPGS